MNRDTYQDYLYLIGELKDRHGLNIDVDHQDIHSFYKDKKPLFKLFYGMFTGSESPSIVVSFHINLRHPEVIKWFIDIYRIDSTIAIHDSYIDDDNGETYLGEDAETIKEVYMTQEVLKDWLDRADDEEIQQFTEAKVVGRVKEPNKIFDPHTQRLDALMEFDKIRKPSDDEEVH